MGMRLCGDAITVFNARVDPQTRCEAYAPTVLRGCRWFARRGAKAAEGGLKGDELLVVRVPIDVDAGGRRYTEPRDYHAAASVDGLWTLQPGDVVVKGVVAGTDTPAQLRVRFADAFTVLRVTDSRSAPRGKHWKIEGR